MDVTDNENNFSEILFNGALLLFSFDGLLSIKQLSVDLFQRGVVRLLHSDGSGTGTREVIREGYAVKECCFSTNFVRFAPKGGRDVFPGSRLVALMNEVMFLSSCSFLRLKRN